MLEAQHETHEAGHGESKWLDLMNAIGEIIENTSRENANIGNSPSAKMLQIASSASREYYLDRVIPDDIACAHRNGDIHIHDLDYYGKTLTCVHIPLEDCWQRVSIPATAMSARPSGLPPPRRLPQS